MTRAPFGLSAPLFVALTFTMATGCGDGSDGNGGDGGAGGTGGNNPATTCQKASAEALQTCVAAANQAWADCYAVGDAPCDEDEPSLEQAIEGLRAAVVSFCTEEDLSLSSVKAWVDRLQVSCTSEAASLASRSFGGPHGRAWAIGDTEARSCLSEAHLSASLLMDAGLEALNGCLPDQSCDAAQIEMDERRSAEAAQEDIEASCLALQTLIATNPEHYLARAQQQVDCMTATVHADTEPLRLSCGPSLVDETPPRGQYVQIMLDSEQWNTRCGDGSPYYFQLRLAPEGEPLDRILIGMEGGGVCIFEGDCTARWNDSPDLFEAQSDEAPNGGVMSDDPQTNPFANWTKVFLPYCNQDVFIGGGSQQEFTDFTLHRNGAVNVRAAIEYVRNLLWKLIDDEGEQGYRPDEMIAMLGGWSAGGFGTLYNYHFVLDDVQWPRSTAFPDAALALDTGTVTGIGTLGALLIANWGSLPYLPPYCFDSRCAIGPEIYQASAPRLLAVPNQQFLILGNQNDQVQVDTTFFESTSAWINTQRSSVCATRDLPGIHYYLTSDSESIHVVSLRDELYEGSVDGSVMSDWLWNGVLAAPETTQSQLEEASFVEDVPGVDPFPCEVAP